MFLRYGKERGSKLRLLILAMAFIFVMIIVPVKKSEAATKRTTGMYYVSGKWRYYENGTYTKITSIVKGTVDGESGWWYVRNGILTRVDIVAKNDNGWFYCKKGKVDFNYKGFGKNSKVWFWCENGRPNFNATGLYMGTVDGVTANWYVEKGKVKFINTVAKNSSGWWAVRKGKVDYSFNGICSNASGSWYCKNGKVDFSYKGFASCSSGWFFIVDGKVDTSQTGIFYGTVNGTYGIWYVLKGKVQFKTLVMDFNGSKVYIKSGKFMDSYTGLVKDGSTTWYISNGFVDFDAKTVVKGTVNGVSGWWYVSNGRVTYVTTIASNENGQWYVVNGKVDFSYTGNVTYGGQTYYISGGQVVRDGDENAMLKKAQNYSSNTNYLIMVSRDISKVMVLKGSSYSWTPIYYWDCNCGAEETETPTGEFTTAAKILYFGPEDEYRCWYATQFFGECLFHSVIYDVDDAPNWVIDGRLGVNTSHGCIRLLLENAKWLYDNIPYGTKVVVY
ncbi:L,D-transpeptidase catalytic domain [Eubacterium ruminantium]|nr:L,D-transpeptidase catalytic domain [Eubacterium ruminantium]